MYHCLSCIFLPGVSAHSCVRASVECMPVHFSMCDMCVVGMWSGSLLASVYAGDTSQGAGTSVEIPS